ncbi:MAG: N-6 DNA methylase [bacterium]|nr:N-6 DNA methylase [bacterium]
MARSTTHYADSETNNILKRLHNKLRPAGTPVMRVEYIIELLLLRIFEAKLKQDETFAPLRKLFADENYRLLFSHLLSLNGEQILSELNKNIFPFYSTILSKTRTVTTGNLPQKMQDQLVLMEEVFANSNFTNNVKGGVIAEVIGMVNEIDEKYILKTDLLGDAIESALSETGGTKDLGLYRTPDHIRKMMVEMVDPDFTDTIYDPACGTAGFLFDAYDYVIENKAMPDKNLSQQFYRTGIGGIEYAGMIRKMAAINLYIRGLNPHNIQQGDSLALYDPSKDAGSKSVIIANPPFGAEKDQPAYPNVWEDYPKGDTTTLFVKLMFDLLNAQGRCAVVISEGLLTWNSGDAVSLRKLLLNEANLRAVISLPQGVFVSKSGQGAKTSILYFEKGQPTDFVWFYKIENDGFSMGTNRKAIANGQIPELLEIFKEVKQGKKPQDTKHSFCISKEQIETLDPRIAERIKKEVSEKTKEKNIKKREKLVEELDKKLAGKKISKELYDEKLWQFDNIIDGQIDNEVAKAIEKAHSYHFNLQNYRSSLSDEQIKDWQETLKGVEIKNGSKIDKRYQELQKAEPKVALQILASFDTKNALQMDIAREYLSKLDKKVLDKDEKLAKLFELLKETKVFPFESLGALIAQKENKIKLDDDILYKQVTIKLYGKGILVRQEVAGSEIKTEAQFIVNAGDFIMSKIDARNGAFGIVPEILEGAVVTTSFPYFEIQTNKVNPQYLESIVTQKSFYDQINNMVSGATGRRSVEVDNFLELQIPLPPLEVQNEIVEKIEKQKQIIEGAEKIENNFYVSSGIFVGEKLPIGEFITILTDYHANGSYETLKEKARLLDSPDYAIMIRTTDLENNNFETDLKYVDKESYDFLSKTQLFGGEIIVTKIGSIGSVFLMPNLNKPATLGMNAFLLRVDDKKTLNKYLFYWLVTSEGKSKIIEKQLGVNAKTITKDAVRSIEVPLPSLETQRQIVEKLDRQMQALEGVQLLKSEAEKRIEEILAGVWGE